ncbi:hypothetical protein D3C72_1291910 [compost metagenome]
MHPLCLGMDISRKCIRIGRFQLRQLPPVDDLARQFDTFRREIFQNLCRCRPLTGLGLGTTRQTHLAKKDIAELLWRSDIETLACQLVDFLFEGRSLLREFAGKARENLPVDGDAALFHMRQNRHEGALQPLIDLGQPFRHKPRLQRHP